MAPGEEGLRFNGLRLAPEKSSKGSRGSRGSKGWPVRRFVGKLITIHSVYSANPFAVSAVKGSHKGRNEDKETTGRGSLAHLLNCTVIGKAFRQCWV